jgi:hypothetical protein
MVCSSRAALLAGALSALHATHAQIPGIPTSVCDPVSGAAQYAAAFQAFIVKYNRKYQYGSQEFATRCAYFAQASRGLVTIPLPIACLAFCGGMSFGPV